MGALFHPHVGAFNDHERVGRAAVSASGVGGSAAGDAAQIGHDGLGVAGVPVPGARGARRTSKATSGSKGRRGMAGLPIPGRAAACMVQAVDKATRARDLPSRGVVVWRWRARQVEAAVSAAGAALELQPHGLGVFSGNKSPCPSLVTGRCVLRKLVASALERALRRVVVRIHKRI